jgi:hypothetical protein
VKRPTWIALETERRAGGLITRYGAVVNDRIIMRRERWRPRSSGATVSYEMGGKTYRRWKDVAKALEVQP